jgi:capsular exopolysaccharide synthesis family protein
VGGGSDALATISSYRRYLWLFILVFVLVSVPVATLMIIQPKAYTAVASVALISPDKIAAQGEQGYKPAGDNAMTGYLDSAVDNAKSSEVVAAVLDQNGLLADPEFNPPRKTPQPPELVRQAAILRLSKHVKVARAGTSFVAKISFTASTPMKAAKLANAYALAFVTAQQQSKIAAAKDANDLITAQLSPLKAEVEKAENAVAQYKVKHGLLGMQGKSMNEQEIGDLTQQLALARVTQAEAEARLASAQKQMESGASGEALGEALNSPVIQKLRDQRGPISATLAEQESRLGPKHPAILTTRRELADIDAQIQAEVTRILSNVDSQVDVARQRTNAIVRELNTARAGLANNDTASVDLDQLQRDADASRALYETSLLRAKTTGQQQQISQADAQITGYAEPPLTPSAPNKPLAVLLGLMAGIAFGVIAVVIRRMFDSTLRTQEEVETRLGVPYLAGIPTVDSSITKPETREPIEAILKHPLSGFAESFRSLSTAVTLSRATGVKLIAITSSLPNEGKTTTTICLAEVLAIGGAKVMVLDCDLRRRSVNAALKADAKFGLTDVINGSKTLEEARHLDPRSGVEYLLLPRAQLATARSPLDMPEFDALLGKLRAKYDHIILDTPPLLPIVDTRKLAKKVDTMVLLCRWQHTPRRAVQHSIRLLQDVGAEISGVALTRVDLKAQQRYGYGDSSYYYQGYSDYLESQTAE